MTLRIKDWSRFQHFKDRKPPWIKLYRDLLDDIQWHELDPAASKVLVMLWLIASEDGGALPANKELAFRLRITEKQLESTVSKLSHWLYQDDDNVIPSLKQPSNVSDHQETETYKEETEKPVVLPDWIPIESWRGWIESRKKKPTKRALELAVEKLAEFRADGQDPRAVLDASTLGGWSGLFPLRATEKKNGTPAWWSSDASIEAKGREFGLSPKPGENWQQFKGRVQQKIDSSPLTGLSL